MAMRALLIGGATAAFALSGAIAMADQPKGPVHITSHSVEIAGTLVAGTRDEPSFGPIASDSRAQARAMAEAERSVARLAATEVRDEARQAMAEARAEAEVARAEARATIQEAVVASRQARFDASGQIDQARRQLEETTRQIEEQARRLVSMKAGDFTHVVIDENGAVRCGAPTDRPGCTPLTDADKASILADMQQGLDDSRQGLADAQRGLEDAARALSEESAP